MWLTDSDCGEEWLNMSMFLLTVSQTSFAIPLFPLSTWQTFSESVPVISF